MTCLRRLLSWARPAPSDPDEARRAAVLALRDAHGGTLRCCPELHEIARGGREWEEWWNPDGTRSGMNVCPRWVAWTAEQPASPWPRRIWSRLLSWVSGVEDAGRWGL